MFRGMGLRSFIARRSSDATPRTVPPAAERASAAPAQRSALGRVIWGPWRWRRRPAGAAVSLLTWARGWQAAKQGRLFADWGGATGRINDELRQQLKILRNRARELEQNSDLARRYLALVETHVVGPAGFLLQVRGQLRDGRPDTAGNARVERAFQAWAMPGVCELTGRLSFPDCQRLIVRTAARDGEALIRLHDVRPTRDNPWGFVIELLDPARLDTQYNDDLRNGNRVRLGVELNPAGRPVAYWLVKEGEDGTSTNRERVPATDLIHAFLPDQPEQLRGVPWLAAAMPAIHMLDAYQEAAVTAARVGAAKMGFFTTPDGMPHALASEEGDPGDFLDEAEPGAFGVLPHGYSFQPFNPDYPHQAYERFVKTVLHDIAVGLGVSYHALTGDLSEVNFSSARAGTLEDRERWMTLQHWFAHAVLRPIYRRWLSNALLNTDLAGRLGQSEAMQRYSAHHWQGRRWPWVDPLKDIQATRLAIAAGLRSPQQVAAEIGVDIEDVLDEIARFQQLAAEKGVTVSLDGPGRGGTDGDTQAADA